MVINHKEIKKVFNEGKGMEAPAGAFNFGQNEEEPKNKKKGKKGDDPWTIKPMGELDPEKLI